MVKSAIGNKEIAEGKKEEGLGEEDLLAVVSTEAKKRKDSIKEYKKAEREDLAEKEEQELVILKEYLPEELGVNEIRAELEEVIKEAGTNKKEDFGRLMSMAVGRLKGRAEGGLIKAELEKLLE